MGAGVTTSVRNSSALSWLTGISMPSGWPRLDTIRECPKLAAYAGGHNSNAAASAPTKGLVFKTNAKDEDTPRDIVIIRVHPKLCATCDVAVQQPPIIAD